MDMDYFWAKHGKKVIVGGIALLIGLIALIYFVFIYKPPVEPEPLPDVFTTISVEVEESKEETPPVIEEPSETEEEQKTETTEEASTASEG